MILLVPAATRADSAQHHAPGSDGTVTMKRPSMATMSQSMVAAWRSMTGRKQGKAIAMPFPCRMETPWGKPRHRRLWQCGLIHQCGEQARPVDALWACCGRTQLVHSGGWQWRVVLPDGLAAWVPGGAAALALAWHAAVRVECLRQRVLHVVFEAAQ